MRVYTLDQCEEWDCIVRSFSNYDVYWLSGYARAFGVHGDGEPLLLYAETKGARGINIVMKRDVANSCSLKGLIAEGNFYDLASPYGCGGWLIEGSEPNDLLQQYSAWCRDSKIVSEFVRFHPLEKNEESLLDVYEVIDLGKTVTLDLSSPEVIWKNISSKNRNMIRKAKKNGIQIFNGRYPEVFEKFQQVYNATMARNEASEYYYFNESFYDAILHGLPANAQVFYAVLDGEMIAASIILCANGRMTYFLSGSVREKAALAPTNLLLYEAALWGCANGCKTFYLGGGVGSSEDALYSFKKSFFRNGDHHLFRIGKKVWDTEMYEKLVSMTDGASSNYFPLYRG